MRHPKIEKVAKVLFAVYVANSGGRAWDGKLVPTWRQIEEGSTAGTRVTDHWYAVASFLNHTSLGHGIDHDFDAAGEVRKNARAIFGERHEEALKTFDDYLRES